MKLSADQLYHYELAQPRAEHVRPPARRSPPPPPPPPPPLLHACCRPGSGLFARTRRSAAAPPSLLSRRLQPRRGSQGTVGARCIAFARLQDQRFATTGIRVAFMQKEFRAVLQVAALHPVHPCAPASASATLCIPRTLAPSATLCTCLCLHLSAPAAAPPLHPPHLSNPMLPLCTPSAPSPHATSAGQGHRQPHHHTDRTRRRADHLRHGAQRRDRRPCSTRVALIYPCRPYGMHDAMHGAMYGAMHGAMLGAIRNATHQL